MIVYRVQDKNGGGVYRGGGGCGKRDDYSAPVHDRPRPFDDFLSFHGGEYGTFLRLTESYRYAFPSLRALHAWFSKEHLIEMAKDGFKVHRFLAEDVLVSDSGWQCIFRAKRAP